MEPAKTVSGVILIYVQRVECRNVNAGEDHEPARRCVQAEERHRINLKGFKSCKLCLFGIACIFVGKRNMVDCG